MPNKRQAIIRTNANPIHWRIYAALGEDELKPPSKSSLGISNEVRILFITRVKCTFHFESLFHKAFADCPHQAAKCKRGHSPSVEDGDTGLYTLWCRSLDDLYRSLDDRYRSLHDLYRSLYGLSSWHMAQCRHDPPHHLGKRNAMRHECRLQVSKITLCPTLVV